MSAPLQLQDFQQVLKTVYLPVRKKAFNISTPLLAAARKIGPEEVTYGGNDLVFDVKFGRRGGFVSSARGFTPAGNHQAREKQGRLSVARTYAASDLDGLANAATKRSEDAYISAAAKMTEDIQEQWQIEQQRVLYGDSLGVRAMVETATSSTEVDVHNPYGIAGAGPGNLHLVEGDTVSVLTANGQTHRGKATITGISLTGDIATVTFGSAISGIQVGDVIVTAVPASTHATDNSWGAEPHGVMSILDVEGNFETFEGLNDPMWKAQKISSATVDELIVMRLLNTIRARSRVDWRTNPGAMLLLTSTGIWQTYGESLLGLRRFAAPTMTINGGFTAVEVAGAALLDDPWAPRGRLMAIHGPDTVFIDLMDWGNLTFEDSVTWARLPNQDAWRAGFGTYWNYGAFMRSSHGVIHGITDTVNYSPVY